MGQNDQYERNGMARAAMILGIFSLITALTTGLIGMVFGALGLCFAFLSRGEEPLSGPARRGAICSLIGMALSLFIIGQAIALVQTPDGQEMVSQALEESGLSSLGLVDDQDSQTQEEASDSQSVEDSDAYKSYQEYFGQGGYEGYFGSDEDQ